MTTKTRSRIAALKSELTTLRCAPATPEAIQAGIQAAVGHYITEFEEKLDWAGAIAARDPADGVRSFFYDSNGPTSALWLKKFAMGLLAGELTHELTQRALERAAEMGDPVDPATRRTRTKELLREIYVLELQDVAESDAGGLDYRPDTNGAAILGATLEDAEDAGLIEID